VLEGKVLVEGEAAERFGEAASAVVKVVKELDEDGGDLNGSLEFIISDRFS
jgi:glutamate synthase domain-containing protein 3